MSRMSIGDFARAAGLSAKALRLYDDIGLVVPAEVDPANGYRWYEPVQLVRARLVARLRMVGMPLERIREIADLPRPARGTALRSYWRQVEADHASQRDLMLSLVDDLGPKETTMNLTASFPRRPAVAMRAGRGARDLDLDAVTVGSRVFAVADGFGEHEGLADRALAAIGYLDEVRGQIDAAALVDEAVAAAAAAVAEQPGSGCTLTALVLGDESAALAHVGDSRAYRVRDGRLERLTRDHTLVQSLVDEGRLTPEEARTHQDRPLINRALAADAGAATQPDIGVFPLRDGDRFVLCTDGVHAVIPAAELADLLTVDGPAEGEAASVQAAVEAAGAPDNYNVVVIDLPASY